MSTVRWYGDKFIAAKAAEYERNVLKACMYLQRKIRDDFPLSGAVGTRSGGGDPSNPSKPGGIPHVQSHALKDSIAVAHEKLAGIVGSTLHPDGSERSYAWYLEFGTPGGRMAERPYFRAALKTYAGDIVSILRTGRRAT